MDFGGVTKEFFEWRHLGCSGLGRRDAARTCYHRVTPVSIAAVSGLFNFAVRLYRFVLPPNVADRKSCDPRSPAQCRHDRAFSVFSVSSVVNAPCGQSHHKLVVNSPRLLLFLPQTCFHSTL